MIGLFISSVCGLIFFRYICLAVCYIGVEKKVKVPTTLEGWLEEKRKRSLISDV
jgi:hypothetical protein